MAWNILSGETICVTAFNMSLFFSPYAYVTAAKVTKNFAYVQATRIPDELTWESLPFYFWLFKTTFSLATLVSALEST